MSEIEAEAELGGVLKNKSFTSSSAALFLAALALTASWRGTKTIVASLNTVFPKRKTDALSLLIYALFITLIVFLVAHLTMKLLHAKSKLVHPKSKKQQKDQAMPECGCKRK